MFQVRLDHEEKQPWDVYVNHDTIIHNGSKTIGIIATIIRKNIYVSFEIS